MGHLFDDPENQAHFFALLAEDLVHMVLLIDDQLVIRYANVGVREVGGYEPDDLVGLPAADLMHPDDLALAFSSMGDLDTSVQRQLAGVPIHVRLLRKDGTYGPVELRGTTFLADPQIRGIAVKVRRADTRAHVDAFLDLLVTTDESEASTVLREIAAAAHFELRASGASVLWGFDGSCFTRVASFALLAEAEALLRAADPSLPWLRAAAALADREGDDPAEPFGPNTGLSVIAELADAADPALAALVTRGMRACWAFPIPTPGVDDRAVLVVWRPFAGSPSYTMQHTVVRYGRFVELALQRWERERQLRHAAEHDQLTGLANRALLHRRRAEFESGPDGGRAYTVVAVDLDGFKPVNDRLGHAAGDELLRVVAARLRHATRHDDVVVRMGGDEFCIVTDAATAPEDAAELAGRVLAAVAAPIALDGETVTVTASIGVAVAEPGESVDEALRRADAALYDAKRAGAGQVRPALSVAS